MASFTGQQKEEMDISAILSTVAYYNEVTREGSVQVGSDLNTIMKNLPESAKAGGDYQTIMAAIEANPSSCVTITVVCPSSSRRRKKRE